MEDSNLSSVPASLAVSAGSHPRMLTRVELPLTICFGSVEVSLRDVLALTPGASIELDRKLQDPVDLRVNGTTVARGELAMVNGSFAIRITEIGDCDRR